MTPIELNRNQRMSVKMTTRKDFKVVLLGDRMTGKTCLMKRYFKGQFDQYESATIGAAFEAKNFTIDGKEYQMGVWDTSGEERYQSICSLYYRDAKAAIICYDVTLRSSFQKLEYWMNELKKVQETCRIYLCANKSDLLYSYEPNPRLEFAESFARENGVKFFLTSSKLGENINELFDEIAEDYVTAYQNTPRRDTIRLPTGVRPFRERTKKCCTIK